MNNDKKAGTHLDVRMKLILIQTGDEESPRDPAAIISGRFRLAKSNEEPFAKEFGALIEKYKIKEVH